MRTEKKAEKSKDTLRITDQFRKNHGTVYDFRCAGERLTLFITPRESDADEGEWRVEAKAGGAADSNVVSDWGLTRTNALRGVADLWAQQQTERGLPAFDWEAIAKALVAVRGIEAT